MTDWTFSSKLLLSEYWFRAIGKETKTDPSGKIKMHSGEGCLRLTSGLNHGHTCVCTAPLPPAPGCKHVYYTVKQTNKNQCCPIGSGQLIRIKTRESLQFRVPTVSIVFYAQQRLLSWYMSTPPWDANIETTAHTSGYMSLSPVL